MNKHLFLSLFLIFIYPAASLSQISFERTYSRDEADFGNSVQQTTDGGYVITGGSGGEHVFPDPIQWWDVYLIKTDSLGDTLWTRTYGGDGLDWGYSVQQTVDGGYVIVGETYSFGAGGSDVYLIKTNASGDTLWTRTYGGDGLDAGYSVQQTFPDSGYVITGKYTHGGDVYLIKTDSLGDTLWTRTYGRDGADIGNSVQQTTDGGYIIAGCAGCYSMDRDLYLIKTDSSGDTLWTRTYGGDGHDRGYSVQQTVDGGYVIVGETDSFGAGGSDVYLIKTNASGDTLWTRTYGGDGSDIGNSVQQTTDEGYVIAGTTYSFGAGGSDVYLIKTNASGDTLWTRTYGGDDQEFGISVQQTTDQGYVIAGNITFPDSMSGFYLIQNVYLIKTDPDGYVGISDNNPPTSELPRSWALSQNYPNPFNPSTTISFEVPGNSALRQHVTLVVYDLRGRLVRTLINSGIEPGNHKVTWNGKDGSGKSVSSGIYLYTLKAGEERHTRKMTILK